MKLVYWIFLQEVADHAHSAAVWCSMEQSLILWYSWPMASTLARLYLSQRRTFWTYVVTVNLFSLYLMNFMFHTMLDATGVVLSVHYESMKCDVLFSQGSVRTIFSRGGHFSHMSKKFLPLYNSAKLIKIDRDFPKLWSQMYCHLFMVHSVPPQNIFKRQFKRRLLNNI